jgi:hypothetical protein
MFSETALKSFGSTTASGLPPANLGSTTLWSGLHRPGETYQSGPVSRHVLAQTLFIPTTYRKKENSWRRKRDSNPRMSFPINGFQVRNRSCHLIPAHPRISLFPTISISRVPFHPFESLPNPERSLAKCLQFTPGPLRGPVGCEAPNPALQKGSRAFSTPTAGGGAGVAGERFSGGFISASMLFGKSSGEELPAFEPSLFCGLLSGDPSDDEVGPLVVRRPRPEWDDDFHWMANNVVQTSIGSREHCLYIG